MAAYKKGIKDGITSEYLHQCFTYHENGSLTWNERPRNHFNSDRAYASFNGRYANKSASTINKGNGYSYIGLDNTKLLRRWVIFVMINGYHPTRSIKTRDGYKDNDRIGNLYEWGFK